MLNFTVSRHLSELCRTSEADHKLNASDWGLKFDSCGQYSFVGFFFFFFFFSVSVVCRRCGTFDQQM